jgi:hypothetical protein
MSLLALPWGGGGGAARASARVVTEEVVGVAKGKLLKSRLPRRSARR